MVKRILVTTDGSPSSFQALPLASELARAMRSEVLLLYVVQPLQPGSEAGSPVPDTEDLQHRKLRDVGQQALAEAADLLGVLEVSEMLLEARHSDVATTIAQAAEEQGADLIVMASHGSTDLGQSILGCVAERVLARARMPVLLVKRMRQEVQTAAAQHTDSGPDVDSAEVQETRDQRSSPASHILTSSAAQD